MKKLCKEIMAVLKISKKLSDVLLLIYILRIITYNSEPVSVLNVV